MTASTVRNPAPSPAAVRQCVTDRVTRENAARYLAGRRAWARGNGYHGPLTRAEASAAQLARLAGK